MLSIVVIAKTKPKKGKTQKTGKQRSKDPYGGDHTIDAPVPVRSVKWASCDSHPTDAMEIETIKMPNYITRN
uniref:Uncharacterized protein n=1 Tax=Anopheles minimus TaxID=112268 RepID=A0A182WNZ0_9DIPT